MIDREATLSAPGEQFARRNHARGAARGETTAEKFAPPGRGHSRGNLSYDRDLTTPHSVPRPDRVTEIHIRGLRTLQDVRLKLGPLTVLIGDNGAGKSSVAEACALLGMLGSETFREQFRVRAGLHVPVAEGV